MQLKNHAAYLPHEKAPQLIVSPAPFPKLTPSTLIVRAHAWAINPIDWKIQSNGWRNVSYPAILGEDVAGEVIEVGDDLKGSWKVGDRVIADAWGREMGNQFGAFQEFVLLEVLTMAKVPDGLELADAVVLGLSLSTAAAGLYGRLGGLELGFPVLKSGAAEDGTRSADYDVEKANGTLLLWGGSSSVGSSVIQLAKASGYHIVCTASPSNYKYCKELGASLILDYHNPDIVDILSLVLKGHKVVGAYDAIGAEQTVRSCAAVLEAIGGGTVVSVGATPDGLPEGVKLKGINSDTIVMQEKEVARKVWGEFVPVALKKGLLKARPEKAVVGKGLESLQGGLDTLKKGVSARKVVVVRE